MLWFKSFLGLNFIFLCFKVMIMYDSSEFKTIEKTIFTKDKIEPQQIYSFLAEVQMNPCQAWVTTAWRLGLQAPFVTCKKECTKITGLMNFLRFYLLWHHNAQEVNDWKPHKEDE